MPDLELLPQTPEQTKVAMLALVGIVGGGLLAYEAGRSIRDGDLFATDDYPPNPKAGVVALAGGLGLFALMVREAVKSVGWQPLALGSMAILGVAVVGKSLRGE